MSTNYYGFVLCTCESGEILLLILSHCYRVSRGAPHFIYYVLHIVALLRWWWFNLTALLQTFECSSRPKIIYSTSYFITDFFCDLSCFYIKIISNYCNYFINFIKQITSNLLFFSFFALHWFYIHWIYI